MKQVQNDLQSDMVDNLVQYKKSCENEKVWNDCGPQMTRHILFAGTVRETQILNQYLQRRSEEK